MLCRQLKIIVKTPNIRNRLLLCSFLIESKRSAYLSGICDSNSMKCSIFFTKSKMGVCIEELVEVLPNIVISDNYYDFFQQCRGPLGVDFPNSDFKMTHLHINRTGVGEYTG